jgi:NADH-quinone oxidoreductase subunit N
MNAIIFTAIWGVLMMFGGVFFRKTTTARLFAIAGLLLVFVVNALDIYHRQGFFEINLRGQQVFNNFNLTFVGLMVLCTLVYVLLSGRDIEKVGSYPSEYFALIFFILCGVCLSATYNSLLTLFLGIEIMSIPLYILTGSDKRNLKSNEAALKYFLMGAFSTGIMLMGIAFMYGGNASGSFLINDIALGNGTLSVMMATGLLFIMVSMAFKVSAAPFHFWTPDVYDGAPTVFTSFMATIVKAAAFMAFLRLFDNAFGPVQPQWQLFIALMAAATLFVGNITAVFQQSVKRMLAYSSIAQAGFMLLSVLTVNNLAKEGLVLYAGAYSLATIGLFAVLLRMRDFTVDGFNGLASVHPLLAACAALFLFSLTGIPLTAGFQSKLMMLMAVVKTGRHLWLVIFALLMAAVSAYYYLRVIQAMYFKEPSSETRAAGILHSPVSRSYKIMLVLVALALLLLGIWPDLLTGWLYY